MFYSAISQIEGYWHGLYDAHGRIPARSQLDPRGMARVLENAMLLERIAPGIARIRLAGMHMSDLMGMEVRGMPITAFFEPAAREAIKGAIKKVCDSQRIVDVDLRSSGGPGRAQLEGRLFMAPLTDDSGAVTRILAALQTKGQIGFTPRRFDGATVSARSLDAARSFELPQPAGAQRAFSEPQADFVAQDVGGSRGPHLRLVHSAD